MVVLKHRVDQGQNQAKKLNLRKNKKKIKLG
jgi:hypothetical protein